MSFLSGSIYLYLCRIFKHVTSVFLQIPVDESIPFSLVAVVRGSFIDSKVDSCSFDIVEYLILGFKQPNANGQVPLAKLSIEEDEMDFGVSVFLLFFSLTSNDSVELNLFTFPKNFNEKKI